MRTEIALALILAALAGAPPASAAEVPRLQDITPERAHAEWLRDEPGEGTGDGGPPRDGTFHPTRMRYLPGNNAAWYARWYALEEAADAIDVTYFNFHTDLFGKALLGKLHEKATEGVDIRLMVDSRGSLNLSTRFFAQAYLREMAAFPNVEVRVFRPLIGGILRIPRDLRQVVASNHDKILLADGQLAVVGGRNLGEAYFAHPEDDDGAYRDSDLLLEGAEVGAAIEQAFAVEFEHLENLRVDDLRHGDREGLVREIGLARDVMDRWIRGQGLIDPQAADEDERELLEELNEAMARHTRMVGYEDFRAAPFAGEATHPARVLDKRSFGDPENDITEQILARIGAARESIVIQCAYLVLTERLYAALREAGERGVAITIVTNSPASTHNLLTQAFFVREWPYYMRDIPGLDLYIVTDEHKIHSKVFSFDGEVAAIGSYNMDPMSETINSELVTLVDSDPMAARVAQEVLDVLPVATRCEIRIDEDGEPVKVVGPDDELRGIAGFLIRILARIAFLRPLV